MAVNLKKAVAEAAMEWIKPGMKLGLGTGSTAKELVDLVGAAVAEGLDVVCVPTSEATRLQAESLNIPLTTLDETPHLDLTIDGADEIAPDLGLIKGGGAAHLREKIVATSSDKMLVIADDSKLVEKLGAFSLPIEVVIFGLEATKLAIEGIFSDLGLKGALNLRMKDGVPLVTDSGNYIFDAAYGLIDNPRELADRLDKVPGIVEHGFFIGIADCAIVAGLDGDEVQLQTLT